MKYENLAHALGEIDEELIYNAINDNPKANKSNWKKLIPIAACVCLIVTILSSLPQSLPEEPESVNPGDNPISEGERALPSNFYYYEKTYIISSYLGIEHELPEGFAEAGLCNVGGFTDVPFFVNPDIPEWIYVYHEVRTTGEVDYSNTLIPAEPHNAYVRYVDSRLRGKNLIYYNGDMYISMFSANTNDIKDVSTEYYETVWKKYGSRIEGDFSNLGSEITQQYYGHINFKSWAEEFVLAGTAVFTGYDSVPEGDLASNIAEAEVYYNPNDPNVLLYENTWYSSKGLHTGYDVYLKYDCPFVN